MRCPKLVPSVSDFGIQGDPSDTLGPIAQGVIFMIISQHAVYEAETRQLATRKLFISEYHHTA